MHRIKQRTQPVPDAKRLLENSIVALLREAPFYGHLLLGCRRRFSSAEHALGLTLLNGTPTLQLDAERFALFSVKERKALLEHVIRHLLHLHPLRRGDRNPKTWYAACDLAINPSIDDLPASSLYPEQYRMSDGLAAEEYATLLSERFDFGNLQGEGVGHAERETGGATGEGHTESQADSLQTIDNHEIWGESDSTPLKLAEQVVRDLVREAKRKAHNEIPDGVRELVEGWLAPPAIPWQQILRQFVASAGRVGRKSTWMREHRRFAHTTPGVRKRHRLNLLVAIDVSESTDQHTIREMFARELLQIARGSDSRITVLYASSYIQKVESFSSNLLQSEVYSGGGFTDLRPPFEYARKMTPPPAAIIYLTDGYGEAPETMEWPTLWVLTEDGQKPAEWGMEIRFAN